MASSNNLASLEPWTFRPSFTDSWISEAFARDTETLTKALQKSLSRDTETLINTDNSAFLSNLFKTESSTPTCSISDPDTAPPRRRNTISNGKITKRKSRATKRSPTTFITADPSNFRQMVQQVTGIRFGDTNHLPVVNPAVLKPEPQQIQSYYLPTLDTSALLLDNDQQQPPTRAVESSVAPQGQVPVGEGGGAASLDFLTFQNFPTLESWRVM